MLNFGLEDYPYPNISIAYILYLAANFLKQCEYNIELPKNPCNNKQSYFLSHA